MKSKFAALCGVAIALAVASGNPASAATITFDPINGGATNFPYTEAGFTFTLPGGHYGDGSAPSVDALSWHSGANNGPFGVVRLTASDASLFSLTSIQIVGSYGRKLVTA